MKADWLNCMEKAIRNLYLQQYFKASLQQQAYLAKSPTRFIKSSRA